jgi:protein kinase-like protein/PA14 domain-containing protein
MGIVYEALDAALVRRVAVKTMVSNPLASPEEAKNEGERFMREAQLAARLPKHPHIVGVYEVGVIQGRRYLAMELIEGKPMDDWMNLPSVTLRDEVELLRQAALAVHHAHEHDIIHRDLKPANILVDAHNEPHITDFGLAKMVGQDLSVSLTGAGMVVGTPAYVSPEQAQGLKNIDRRTDVYSLGVILFEILTGRHPFQGETAMEILMKAAKNPVPSASALMKVRLTATQAKGLDDICHKALAKKPGDRYRDAAAFAADLEKWVKGEEVKVLISTTRRAAAPKKPAGPLFAGLAVALLVLVVVLVQIFSTPSVDPVAAERQRKEEMRLASERRAEEERFRQEKEKLAAAQREAEDRAKQLEREIEAMSTPLFKAEDVKNAALLRPGLVAEYFSGTNFEMLLQRKIEPELRVRWEKVPAWQEGPIDMITMRWHGYLRVPERATYVFQANALEGMRVFIDNVEILSNWMSRSRTPERAVAYLDQGLHQIFVEMYKTNALLGAMWLTCKKSNDPSAATLDGSHFLHDPSMFAPVARKAAPEFANRKTLKGAQEAEALKILEGEKSTGVLPFAARGKGFLLWAKAKLGDRLVLQFDAPEACEKTLILALARAKNAGIVRIAVNGAVIADKVDFYHPVNHFLEHEYRRVALRKGLNELEFTMLGSHPDTAPWIKADGMPKFSMDYLRLR